MDEALVEALCAEVTQRLTLLASPVDAADMAAYMKTTMPFYGVKRPELERMLRELRKRHPIKDAGTLELAARSLWGGSHREEKYLAIRLLRAHRGLLSGEAHMDLFEQMIREGSWWDFTDEIAKHLVGYLLAREPETHWPRMSAWLGDEHMWVRRAALLCQLGFKAQTDAGWLFDACGALMHEQEFFIRKAIGWALRDYAYTDPQAVRAWTGARRETLSKLSYREARKHLD